MIAPGTHVEWESQSRGYRATKRGVVLAYLPSGEDVSNYTGHITARGRIKVSASTYTSRVDRYVVECRSPSGLPVIYAPVASVLEAQNEEAA